MSQTSIIMLLLSGCLVACNPGAGFGGAKPDATRVNPADSDESGKGVTQTADSTVDPDTPKAESRIASLSIGEAQLCWIKDGRLGCNTENRYRSNFRPPRLADPKIVSVNGSNGCVVDNDTLKCWILDDKWRLPPPPKVKNVKQLQLGAASACVLDDDGIKCWAVDSSINRGVTDVPALTRPTAFSTIAYTTCAIDQGRVKCWGENDSGQAAPPEMQAAITIAVGGNGACAIENGTLRCWGSATFKGPPIDIPKLASVDALCAGISHFCARSGDEVSCWGDQRYPATLKVPKLQHPTELRCGWSKTCALVDGGFKCWGEGIDSKDIDKAIEAITEWDE